MNPIPTVSKNSPLKIDEVQEQYQESWTEKRGKVVFGLGVVVFGLIVASTFGVFSMLIKSLK